MGSSGVVRHNCEERNSVKLHIVSKRKSATTPQVNKPGRILIVITTLTFGGAETQVVRLASELKARGWTVSVVCLVKPTAYLSQLEQEQIEVHSLDMPRGVPDLRAVFRLASIVRDFRPDVVHCHMFHANILGRVARPLCHMPVLITTAHNLRETSEKGGPTWHKELLYRVTDPLADMTTIICNAAFERYIRVGAVPRNKFAMIPNGVDTQVFSASEERRQSARRALGIGSEFVWLAVGRLVKQKDYPNLFRAVETLEGKDFVVLIAGDGPLEQDLREECRKRGLGDRVRFCGAREDILDLYQAADAFVMSSEFEGLSAALLEAASAGLPAVVTDVGGNADIVIHDVTGYVVPPAESVQLGAAMQRLMEGSPEHLQTMSASARKHCHEQYRISTIMDKWLELYAKCALLNGPSVATEFKSTPRCEESGSAQVSRKEQQFALPISQE
jgi:glycosyltransferase involved in cell wall biosynthesis